MWREGQPMGLFLFIYEVKEVTLSSMEVGQGLRSRSNAGKCLGGPPFRNCSIFDGEPGFLKYTVFLAWMFFPSLYIGHSLQGIREPFAVLL